MPLRKNAKSQVKTIILEIPATSDLPLRIEKISEQTGLGALNLIQKWILQEESLIGLIQRGKDHAAEQTKTRPDTPPQQDSDVQQQESPAEIDPNSSDYRKVLIKRVNKLQKGGTTLVKIAEIFNEEHVPTVSGRGKWYSSSIINLLNSKV
jgi:hypothetical protein